MRHTCPRLATWGILARPRAVAVPISTAKRSAPKATILAAPHGGGHSIGGQNLSILKFKRRTERQRPPTITTFLRISSNGNGHDNENGLNNGYNDNGKADILTFVLTGHFNFRLTSYDIVVDFLRRDC